MRAWLLAGMTFACSPVFACSVFIPDDELHLHTTEAWFRQAREVFLAEVDRIQLKPVGGSARRIVRFNAVEQFKGTPPDSFTRDMGADLGCGPDYLEGGRYVLFFSGAADQNDSRLVGSRGPLEAGADWTREYLDALSTLSRQPVTDR